MPDFDAHVARLNQLRGEIEQATEFPPPGDVFDRLSGVVAELKAKVEQAQADLHQEIQAMAADLRAKVAAIEQQAAKAAAAKRAAPEPPPAPWEDHQGLARQQMQTLADVLVQLGQQPRHPAGRP